MSTSSSRTSLEPVGSWMNSPWSCDQCQAEFPIGALLAHHLSQCKGLSSCSYMSHSQLHLACPLCHRYNRRRNLIDDEDECKKPKDKVKVYRSIEALDKHIGRCPHRGKDPNVMPFRCDYCNQTFPQFLTLVQHVLVFHEVYRTIQSICLANIKPRGYSCHACSKFFGSAAKLATHVSKSPDCQGCVILSHAVPENEIESCKKQVPVYRAVTLIAQNTTLQREYLRKYPYSRVGMEYVTYEVVSHKSVTPSTSASVSTDKAPQAQELTTSETVSQDSKPSSQFDVKSMKKIKQRIFFSAGEDKEGTEQTPKVKITYSSSESRVKEEARKRKTQNTVSIVSLLPGAVRSHQIKKRKVELLSTPEPSPTPAVEAEVLDPQTEPPAETIVKEECKEASLEDSVPVKVEESGDVAAPCESQPITDEDANKNGSEVAPIFENHQTELLDQETFSGLDELIDTIIAESWTPATLSQSIQSLNGLTEEGAAMKGNVKYLDAVIEEPLAPAVAVSHTVNGSSVGTVPVKESMRDRIKRIRSMKKDLLVPEAPVPYKPRAKQVVVSLPVPFSKPSSAAPGPQRPINVGNARKRTSFPNKNQMTARKSGSCPLRAEEMSAPTPKREAPFEMPVPRVLTCPACLMQFSSLLQRDAHLKQTHQGLKVFGCQICGHSFDTYQSFRIHCVRKHPNEMDVAMYGDSCLGYSGEDTQNDIAEDDMEFVCPVCALVFFNDQVLMLHMQHDHASARGIGTTLNQNNQNKTSTVKSQDTSGNDNKPQFTNFQHPQVAAPIVQRTSAAVSLSADDFCFLSNKSVLSKHVTLNSALQQPPSTASDSSKKSTEPSVQPPDNVGLSRWEKLWLAYYDLKPEDLCGSVKVFPNAYRSPLCCRACGEEMFNELEALIHWKREHSNSQNGESSSSENMLACHCCYQLFLGLQAVSDIKVHLKSVHEKSTKGYVCEECNCTFSRQKLLEWHSKTHSNERDEQISPPPVCFNGLVHPALYVCPHCSKLFAGQEAHERLQTHISLECSEQGE